MADLTILLTIFPIQRCRAGTITKSTIGKLRHRLLPSSAEVA